jgi:kexin
VIVKDTIANDHHGSFTDWKITLWGECRDPAKAKPLPMPTEKDDDDHDKTETVSASTTSLTSTGKPTPSVTANPTDHPDRPVNAKPTATNTMGTSSPTQTSAPATSSGSNNILPFPFPTFGVSKRTQIWIYGSIALMVLFCAGIGIYLYLARRKRLRNNVRDDYEFEILSDEDDEGNGSRATRKPQRRRGGELYDAFAGESEEDLFAGGTEKGGDPNADRATPDEANSPMEEPGGKSDREKLLGR